MKLCIVIITFVFLTACAGKPPFLEYTISQKALKSARKVNADQNATTYWLKASSYYQKAEQRFQNRDYISARRFFNESIKWAEKAENLSRFKMSAGEGM